MWELGKRQLLLYVTEEKALSHRMQFILILDKNMYSCTCNPNVSTRSAEGQLFSVLSQ